jgi:hypothetical protein
MSIKNTIHSAGQNLHTIMLTAKEKDGSVETREAESYSYRVTAGTEKFFCYDIKNVVREICFFQILSQLKKLKILLLQGGVLRYN